MTFYSNLDLLPNDALFGLVQKFKESTDQRKVNLTIGAYRDENGNPKVLDCVRKAETILLNGGEKNKEYLPIIGDQNFIESAQQLLLGTELADRLKANLASIQTLSGTGALRVAFDLIKKCNSNAVVYMSSPTWGNHKKLVCAANLTFRQYRYFDAATCSLDFRGMISDLQSAPAGSVLLLHACAHNPTGVDPSAEQWRTIAELARDRRLHVLFDVAYQGYVTGDAMRDGAAIRMFIELGLPVMCCQSFSKIFGLYCERVGGMHVILASDAGNAQRVQVLRSHLARIARTTYSNPPAHGARIVATVWKNAELRSLWHAELLGMAQRIEAMRQRLFSALNAINAGGPNYNWSHVTKQRGMFCYTGLAEATVERIVNHHAVFMTSQGRISMAGLNESNVDYVASAIKEALSKSKL